MNTIKSSHIYAENILIVGTDNKIWIMGENKYRKTGFGIKNKALYSPIFTGIELSQDETINDFYCYKYLLAIYTSKGNLWVSRNLLPNKYQMISENHFHHEDNYIDDEDNTNDDNEDNSDNENNSDDEENILMSDDPEQEIDLAGGQVYLRENPDGTVGLYLLERHGINRARSRSIISEDSSGSQDEISDHIITNFDFFEIMSEKFCEKNIKTPGFDLLEEGIDAITFSETTIFFRKNEKIYVFNSYLNTRDTITSKCFGFSCVYIEKGNTDYYQLIFPFECQKVAFTEKFLYLSSGKYHYVIVGPPYMVDYCPGLYCPGLYCIYFKTLLEIDEKNINYIKQENSVYITKDEIVYKYYHSICDIKKFIGKEYTTKILSSNDGLENLLVCCKDDKIFLDNGTLDEEIPKYHYNKYIIDMNNYCDHSLIIINVDSSECCLTFFKNKNNIYVNVKNFKYYKLIDTGLLYYEDGTLYYFTNLELSDEEHGTVELDKLSLPETTFYYYMFKNLPEEIDDIQFTNDIIVIKSKEKYYYYTLNHNNTKFVMNNFTEIIIGNQLQNFSLVTKHQVIRNKKIFQEEPVTLHISKTADKFDKLLSIIEMLRNKTDFNINFVEGKKNVSYGDGPKREFMEEAAIIFSDKYLIIDRILSKFNTEALVKFTDDELICIGSMLHAIICHSVNHLPIRLPIMFMELLLKKKPTITELEYFAKLEDLEAYNNLYAIKDNLPNINECGFDSYENALKFLCKYLYNDDFDKQKFAGKQTNAGKSEDNEYNKSLRIGKLLAIGFKHYSGIKNMDRMNFPTLDYYLSGDYIVDRNRLIKNLVISNNTSSDTSEYKNIFVDLIKSLPEDKLMILLKNWSGTSVVEKSRSYKITIESRKRNAKDDVYFATCDTNIILSAKFVKKYITELLIDVLTTPMTSMQDIRILI